MCVWVNAGALVTNTKVLKKEAQNQFFGDYLLTTLSTKTKTRAVAISGACLGMLNFSYLHYRQRIASISTLAPMGSFATS